MALDPSTEFILNVVERVQGTLLGNKHDLKKQSQFASGQNGVKSYLKGYYGNNNGLLRPKKQSQFKANVLGNGYISRRLEVFDDSGGVDCQQHKVVQIAEGIVPLFSGVIDVQHAEAA